MVVNRKSATTSLLLLLLLSCASRAEAAKRTRAIFRLGGLTQSVTLDYLYSGVETDSDGAGSRSSSSNRFRESYDAGINYSLIGPRLLNGQLKVGVQLDQNRYSASGTPSTGSNKAGIFYNLDGTFLDRSPVSVGFFTRSDYDTVSLPYGTNYDLNSNSFGFSLDVKNETLPFQAEFQRAVSESSGARDDRKQTTQRLALRSNHVTDQSSTDLNATRSEYRSEAIGGDIFPSTNYVSYLLSGRNTLQSSDQKKRLTSMASLVEEKSPDKQQRLLISEGFGWQLGRVLLLNLDYSGGWLSLEPADGQPATDSDSHTGSVALTHRLYESLTSRIAVSRSVINQNDGKEILDSGVLDLNYVKKLGPEHGLSVGYNERRSWTDRDLASGTLQEREEITAQLPGPVPPPPGQEDNQLRQMGIDQASIVVRDSVNRAVIYEPGTDYQVLSVGAFTALDFTPPTSRIVQGQALVVSYTYEVDPSVSFVSYGRSLGVGLGLDNGVWKFNATVQQAGQELRSGNARTVSPYDDMSYSFNASWQVYPSFVGFRWVMSESDFNPYQYYQLAGRTILNVRGGNLTLQAREKYTLYERSRFRDESSWDNSFNCSADYGRRLFGGSFQVNAGYSNAAGGGAVRHDFGLGSTYRWALGKFDLDLTAKTNLLVSDGYSVRNDQFNMRLIRTF